MQRIEAFFLSRGFLAPALALFIALGALSSSAFAAGPSAAEKSEALPTQVNINTADAATLAAMLDGIGESRAKAIVDYRAANGPFKSADDLIAVKGVGKAVVDRNRTKIKVK